MAKKNDDTPVPGGDAASAAGGVNDAADISSLVELVRMVRNDGMDPKEADVHPDEVSNYERGGWVVDYPITKEE